MLKKNDVKKTPLTSFWRHHDIRVLLGQVSKQHRRWYIYQIIKSDDVKRRNAIATPLRGNTRRSCFRHFLADLCERESSAARRFVERTKPSSRSDRFREMIASRLQDNTSRREVTDDWHDYWIGLRIVECSYPTHVPPHHVSLRRASAFQERRENTRLRSATLPAYFSSFAFS